MDCAVHIHWVILPVHLYRCGAAGQHYLCGNDDLHNELHGDIMELSKKVLTVICYGCWIFGGTLAEGGRSPRWQTFAAHDRPQRTVFPIWLLGLYHVWKVHVLYTTWLVAYHTGFVKYMVVTVDKPSCKFYSLRYFLGHLLPGAIPTVVGPWVVGTGIANLTCAMKYGLKYSFQIHVFAIQDFLTPNHR